MAFLHTFLVGLLGANAGAQTEVRLVGCRTSDSRDGTLVTWYGGINTHTASTGPGGLRVQFAPGYPVIAGDGTLTFEGHAPIVVTWTTPRGGLATCQPDTLELNEPTTWLAGRVHFVTPNVGSVEVAGCGGSTRPAADGSFRMATVQSDDGCDVRARYNQSPWWGPAVEVDLNAQVPVQVSATPEPISKHLGLELRTEGGHLIVSAAAGPRTSGFEVGDRIVAIDGTAVADLEVPPVTLANAVLHGRSLRVRRAEREWTVFIQIQEAPPPTKDPPGL